MPMHFTCPYCGTTTNVADQYVGQSGPCTHCGKSITVPPSAENASFNDTGTTPKRGLGPGATCLIALAAAVPIVVVCGGILLALLLPAVQAAREAARRMHCANNLRQIGLAMHDYAQEYGCFPPAYIADKDGKPMHSWRVLLLPYMEQQARYDMYRFDEPWDGPNNSRLAPLMPKVYQCPSAGQSAPWTSYAMIVGPHAISDGPTPRRMNDIKDGTSNTIIVAEVAREGIHWMEPRDLNTETMSFAIDPSSGKFDATSNNHPGVVNVLLGDGSVRCLSSGLDPEVLKALMTIDGGEDASGMDVLY